MANNRELSQFASFVEVGISSIGFTTSVGIGKTNPQFNLDVAGDINFTGTFYQGGTQFIASRWSATGSDIYRLSKVGINTSIVPSALTVNGDVSVSGVVTATSINVSGISTLGITSATNLTSQSLVVSGISTFTNGPILVGTATSTGTASQPLQVTGGAYVSGNLGVGVTSPIGVFHTRITTDRNLIFNTSIGGDARITALNDAANTNVSFVLQGTDVILQSTGGSLRVASSGNVGIGTTNPTAKLSIGSVSGFQDTITTVATTAVTTIDSFATATFRSTRAQVQITQSTNYQASDVLIIHDGTNASIVEYGSIATNDYLGTFSASVSGGNCLLRINMSSATSATVKVLSQRITV